MILNFLKWRLSFESQAALYVGVKYIGILIDILKLQSIREELSYMYVTSYYICQVRQLVAIFH